MELGSRILAWLKFRGMTQKKLAKKVGVSPGAVTAWIQGSYAPSHRNTEGIVAALEITMAEFYGPIPKAKRARAAA